MLPAVVSEAPPQSARKLEKSANYVAESGIVKEGTLMLKKTTGLGGARVPSGMSNSS